MHKFMNWGMLRRGAATLAMLPVVTIGFGVAQAAPAATNSTVTTVLFQQPKMAGIAGNLVVPPATGKPVPFGAFKLVLWQPNRFQASGQLVVAGWSAGSHTGFTPAYPLTAQLGFRNIAGTSTAQMEGDTVGVYINSADLPPSTADQKMMITPQFRFVRGSEPQPFASANTVLRGAMDLQIPTAVGTNAYAVMDLLFQSTSGVRISYGVEIFHNGRAGTAVHGGYDAPSTCYMLNTPLGVDSRFVSKSLNSAGATGEPWIGWRHFAWQISEAQFVSALKYLKATYPGVSFSTDPTQYVLSEMHLNAEFHTKGKPAELGWSMRGLKLWTVR